MADGGRYRRRRHARLRGRGVEADRRAKPHQPHYQALDYNPLNGGIERWFEPIVDDIGDGASMLARSSLLPGAVRRPRARDAAWHIEVHQFRIEARPGERAGRRRKACTATAWTTCWCCSSNRRNIASGMTDHPRARRARARSVHADRAVRRRARGRHARGARRHAGRSPRPGTSPPTATCWW